MRSANLLNDYAFKYVFGQDSKDANDALKALLTVFLEKHVEKVVVKNSELVKNVGNMKSPRLDLLVEFDDKNQVDLEMQLKQTKDDLPARFGYYLARLHGSQDIVGKYYKEIKSTIVLVFLNVNMYEKDDIFYRTFQLRDEHGEVFEKDKCRMRLDIVEMKKVDSNKSLEEMSDKEKLIYYFKNCQKGKEDSKIKEMIEQDEVIRMVEKRVENIEEDRWRKLQEDFTKMHYNEMAMEFRFEAEEAKEEAEKERLNAEKERLKAQKERLNAEKERANAEKERLNAEKERANAEKERLNAEKERANAQKERLNAEKAKAEVKLVKENANKKFSKMIRQLMHTMSKEQIASLLDLSIEEVTSYIEGA